MDIIVVAVKGEDGDGGYDGDVEDGEDGDGRMVRMVRKRIMVTSIFAEEGEQLSGRRNFALGLIRDGTDLSWWSCYLCFHQRSISHYMRGKFVSAALPSQSMVETIHLGPNKS